jgi:tRNA-specific 2-thiouridylase
MTMMMMMTTRMTTRTVLSEPSSFGPAGSDREGPTPWTDAGACAPRSPVEPPDQSAISAQLRSLAGRRVAVAMSGGVDSAVAAFLLREAGADVIGLSLRLHDPDPCNPLAPRACCPPDDLQDARRVAEVLDIPFYVLDARDAFDDAVVRPFVRDYLDGRTPSPCVGCNSFVKLGRLAKRARALGCDALATGHYARLVADTLGRPHLFTGVDPEKDQSYFLFGTAPSILSMLTFPLGAMSKAAVRDVAMAAGLPVAHKLDSQEVCFVGGGGAGDYVLKQPEAAGDRSGTIVDTEGHVLGRHSGIAGFTVGQRKGIGIAAHHRLHVLQLDAASKTVIVGPREALEKKGLVASRASWPAGAPSGPIRALARIRYRNPGSMADVVSTVDGGVEVHFDEPVTAVAPGQAVVFYAGEEVLGGAWIERAL